MKGDFGKGKAGKGAKGKGWDWSMGKGTGKGKECSHIISLPALAARGWAGRAGPHAHISDAWILPTHADLSRKVRENSNSCSFSRVTSDQKPYVIQRIKIWGSLRDIQSVNCRCNLRTFAGTRLVAARMIASGACCVPCGVRIFVSRARVFWATCCQRPII